MTSSQANQMGPNPIARIASEKALAACPDGNECGSVIR